MNLTGKNAIYLNALPYLNVLPLNEQKLDLWVLNAIGPEVPVYLISKILKQESFELGLDLTIHKKMERPAQQKLKAMQESLNTFKNGLSLSVGYPMLFLEDIAMGRSIAAPLFTWELHLEPIQEGNPNHWMLTYDSSTAMKYNEILKNYLINRFKLDWEELMGDQKDLKAQALVDALTRLAQVLQLPIPTIPKLFACPSSEDDLGSKNCIYWSGLIGRFEPSPDNDESLHISLKPKARRNWHTRIGAKAQHPSIETALNKLFQGKDLLLQKEASSPETAHLISNILPSILSDSGTVLIVSKNPDNFSAILNELQKIGAEDLGIFILRDAILDKSTFAKYLLQLPELHKKTPKLDSDAYEILLQRYLFLRARIVQVGEALGSKVLGDKDWTETVALFMEQQRIDGKQFLSRILETVDFEWSMEEMQLLQKQITENEPLYANVKTLHHPLMALQESFFIAKDLKEASKWANEKVYGLLSELRDLYRRYTTFIDEYGDDLRFHYERHVEELKQQIQNIQRDVKTFRQIYGSSFDNVDSFTNTKVRILSVFSRRNSQIQRAKEHLYKSYEQLVELYNSRAYFPASLPTIRQQGSMSKMLETLRILEREADAWFVRIPKIVRQKTKELNTSLPLPPIQKRRYELLEEEVHHYLEKLQTAHLLDSKPKMLNPYAINREAQLREILETLTVMESSLGSFEEFYHWRRHWLQITEKAQKVITALVSVRPTQWIAAFKSWYLFHFLDKQNSLYLPDTELPLEDYIETEANLRNLLMAHAIHVTHDRQSEQLQKLKKERSFNPKNAASFFEEQTMREVFDWVGLENMLELFPVIMATPEMADKFFEYKVPLFDMVIVDYAHEIETSLASRVSKLGAQKLVFSTITANETANSFVNKTKQNINFSCFDISNSKLSKNFESTTLTLFQRELVAYLERFIAPARLEIAAERDGVLIDVLIHPINKKDAPIALIIDGVSKRFSPFAFKAAWEKAEKLKSMNVLVYSIWSIDWWKSPDTAAQNLAAYVLNWDKQYQVIPG